MMNDTRYAKHVDDITMTGKERLVDTYVSHAENTFGKCKVHKHTYTNCGVRYEKKPDGSVAMDQD
eukprot:11173828-Lingulodinium_polyedra.AAC.1